MRPNRYPAEEAVVTPAAVAGALPEIDPADAFAAGSPLRHLGLPVELWGAKADVVQALSGASITSGSAALTVTGQTFTSADVGKRVEVVGAGGEGTNGVYGVTTEQPYFSTAVTVYGRVQNGISGSGSLTLALDLKHLEAS